jgi:hypothetical protein
MPLPPAKSCVFIAGAARSGSTILQNALNDSPEIFLFGEPNFHTDPGTPDFAARYNAMHRSWSNQETKSSFCPPVLAGDGPWNAYLCQLAKQHSLVGAKTVITTAGTDASAEDWFAFQCRHFFTSRYIFTFRDPLATLFSTQGLQRLTIGKAKSLASIMTNYLAVIALYLRCLRILPNVQAICHEDVDRAGFDSLEAWLGVKLHHAHLYYDSGRVQTYDDSTLDAAGRVKLASINAHFTPLGRLAQEAEKLMASLSADGAQPEACRVGANLTQN